MTKLPTGERLQGQHEARFSRLDFLVGPGRHASIHDLNSLKSSGVRAAPFTRVVDLIRELSPGDIVLTQGAGDVWKIGIDLLRRLKSRMMGGV